MGINESAEVSGFLECFNRPKSSIMSKQILGSSKLRMKITKYDLTTIQYANDLVSWGSVTLNFAQFYYIRLVFS